MVERCSLLGKNYFVVLEAVQIMTPQYIFYKKSQMQAVKRIKKNPNRSGSQAMMICIMFFLFSINTNCKYSIKPSAFQITSRGGDIGSQHEISFTLNYTGSNGSSTLRFPANGRSIENQCPNGSGNSDVMDCDFQSEQASLLSNAGEILIKDNNTFSSLDWNVSENDFLGGDFYKVSINSSEWKLSPNQCTLYEVRIPVNLTQQVKHTKCFSVNLGLTEGASIGSKAKQNSIAAAEANVAAEFGVDWQNCAEWTVPANSYVLYANVLMNSPYPEISHVVSACTSSRIAVKDGYGNNVYPLNPQDYSFPNWITWDNDSYIAKPLASDIKDFNFTLGVLGPCGAKNLTTNIKVQPEEQYSAHSFTVDACTAAKLEIKDSYGNVALATSPGPQLSWIISNDSSYVATPKLTEISSHDVILTVDGPCGAKNVNTTIVVNPEKAYPDVSYSIKACSIARLTVKNAYGVIVPPSAEPTSTKTWLSHDQEGYIAKPQFDDIGIQIFNISMFSYCGPRNVTATVTISKSDDFSVDKKIINVNSKDPVSYHNLSIVPSNKNVKCQYFLNQNGEKYKWVSVTKEGLISLTPTGLTNGTYNLKGVCADKCGHYKDSIIEISISNYANILSSTGIALVAVVYAILF